MRKYEEFSSDECNSLQYCVNYEGKCKIKSLDKNNKLFCNWDFDNCKTITTCTEGVTECSHCYRLQEKIINVF